ncbi:MAG: thiolase family protein, partial [Leptospiraceae bacterium]|nr:thiolase family protein [Leptospiraceae bacterium]
VVGAEIMSRLGREESNMVLGSVLSDRQKQLCMFMSHGGAMITRRYLYEYGYEEGDLYYIAKKVHDNGLKNKNAHIQKEINLEIYNKAPKICTPLGLYDISPLSDGAAALVLSSELKSNIRIKGMGHGTSTFYDDSLGTSFPASVKAFSRAFEEAGISPSEIQVAELHDAFTTFEVIGAEDAGIFKRGEALRQVKEGNTHPAAKWPINPSGGLKSRGHPIAASGIAQLVELSNFMQQQGKALGLTHSIGGLATNNFANILEQV